MSRGLGPTQRRILEGFAEHNDLLTVAEVTAWIFGRHCCSRERTCNTCASNYENVRRALKSLQKRELLKDTFWYEWLYEGISNEPHRYGTPERIHVEFERFIAVVERIGQKSLGGQVLDPNADQQLVPPLSVGATEDPTVTRGAVESPGAQARRNVEIA